MDIYNTIMELDTTDGTTHTVTTTIHGTIYIQTTSALLLFMLQLAMSVQDHALELAVYGVVSMLVNTQHVQFVS